MTKVLVLLADGFEEIEATAIIDVLRRAEIEVTTAALKNERVRGAHGITMLADCELPAVQHKPNIEWQYYRRSDLSRKRLLCRGSQRTNSAAVRRLASFREIG